MEIPDVLDALLRKETLLVEDVEQDETRDHDDSGATATSTAVSAIRGRRRRDREALRQQVRPLRNAPGDNDAGHGEDREYPAAARRRRGRAVSEPRLRRARSVSPPATRETRPSKR